MQGVFIQNHLQDVLRRAERSPRKKSVREKLSAAIPSTAEVQASISAISFGDIDLSLVLVIMTLVVIFGSFIFGFFN